MMHAPVNYFTRKNVDDANDEDIKLWYADKELHMPLVLTMFLPYYDDMIFLLICLIYTILLVLWCQRLLILDMSKNEGRKDL